MGSLNVIQTWKSWASIPGREMKLVEKVKGSPGVTHLFFDDEAVDAFLDDCGDDVRRAVRGFTQRIQAIDLFRVLIVQAIGGLYLDIDFDLEKDLRDGVLTDCVRAGDALFPVERARAGDRILRAQGNAALVGQYAFYAPPDHPFLARIVKAICVPRIRPSDVPQDPNKLVLYTTGPVLVSQCYLDAKRAGERLPRLLRHEAPSRFGQYGRHLMRGTWRTLRVGQAGSQWRG